MEITARKLLNNRYTLVARIGSGGFSVVWLATDAKNPKEDVAIKIYSPQQGLDVDDMELFRAEFNRLAKLNHPYIVKVMDYFEYEESPCIVLEYCSEGNLFRKLKSAGQLSEKNTIQLMQQIGGALQYLHTLQLPMYHLDIKPDNILIRENGDYVLSDFGISNEFRKTIGFNPEIKGETLVYRSPERVLNKPLTEKHDMFAFGVVLLECTQGLLDSRFSAAECAIKQYDLPAIHGYSPQLVKMIYALLSLEEKIRPSAEKISDVGEWVYHTIDFSEEAARKTVPVQQQTIATMKVSEAPPATQKIVESIAQEPIILAPLPKIIQKKTRNFVFLFCAIIFTLAPLSWGIKKWKDAEKAKELAQKSPIPLSLEQRKENDCNILAATANSFLAAGQYQSAEQAYMKYHKSCDKTDPLVKSQLALISKCHNLQRKGDIAFDKTFYAEAKVNYEKYQVCGCPKDSSANIQRRLTGVIAKWGKFVKAKTDMESKKEELDEFHRAKSE